MAISTRTYESGGPRIILEACPAPDCDHEFEGREKRGNHIATHDPEDFGL